MIVIRGLIGLSYLLEGRKDPELAFKQFGDCIPVSCGNLLAKLFLKYVHRVSGLAAWLKRKHATYFAVGDTNNLKILPWRCIQAFKLLSGLSDRNVT
jgi:hypothetical protein